MRALSFGLARLIWISRIHFRLAQAKTGTGKTLAFLIPAIERLLLARPAPPSDKISVLILSVSQHDFSPLVEIERT